MTENKTGMNTDPSIRDTLLSFASWLVKRDLDPSHNNEVNAIFADEFLLDSSQTGR